MALISTRNKPFIGELKTNVGCISESAACLARLDGGGGGEGTKEGGSHRQTSLGRNKEREMSITRQCELVG